MFLQQLVLRNFRNFEDEIIEFPERGAALIGDNGQGKTNLLEAIYYLEIFRSFRGARDEQLIRFGHDYFRVECRLSGAEGRGPLRVATGYSRADRRKKVTVDGQEPGRVGEAIGHVGAIVFTASDVEIVAGGPGARRRFLDIVLSLAEPGYLGLLQRYRQVLAQRNGLLKDGTGRAELAAWNEGLAESGGRIAEARARWTAAQNRSFSRFYAAISGGQRAALKYRPSIPVADVDELEASEVAGEGWSRRFMAELERLVERERRRGVTLVGPHRDDLGFWLEEPESPMRDFGSAGQQRTAAIALRMVEAKTVRGDRGRRPIIMLDDVFAELDPERSRRVLDLFGEEDWGQLVVTSPKPTELDFLAGDLATYRISGGRVRAS